MNVGEAPCGTAVVFWVDLEGGVGDAAGAEAGADLLRVVEDLLAVLRCVAHEMCRERQFVRRERPDVQVVHLLHVLNVLQLALHLVVVHPLRDTLHQNRQHLLRQPPCGKQCNHPKEHRRNRIGQVVPEIVVFSKNAKKREKLTKKKRRKNFV